jgi:hypothetical protein
LVLKLQVCPKRYVCITCGCTRLDICKVDCNHVNVASNAWKLHLQAHTAAVDTQGAVVKIPMIETHVRSLNLAVSVGVGLYEAIRQLEFAQVAAEHEQ